jgi:hypothetical protein
MYFSSETFPEIWVYSRTILEFTDLPFYSSPFITGDAEFESSFEVKKSITIFSVESRVKSPPPCVPLARKT